MWIVKFGVFSIDRTKIYANASKYKTIDKQRLEEKIKSLLEEAEKIDLIKDEVYWEKNLDAIPEELQDKEIEKLQNTKNKLEEQNKSREKEKFWNWEKPKKLTKINLTDKDSRLMQMKRKDYIQ